MQKKVEALRSNESEKRNYDRMAKKYRTVLTE
jgi:hypothetical protein